MGMLDALKDSGVGLKEWSWLKHAESFCWGGLSQRQHFYQPISIYHTSLRKSQRFLPISPNLPMQEQTAASRCRTVTILRGRWLAFSKALIFLISPMIASPHWRNIEVALNTLPGCKQKWPSLQWHRSPLLDLSAISQEIFLKHRIQVWTLTWQPLTQCKIQLTQAGFNIEVDKQCQQSHRKLDTRRAKCNIRNVKENIS